MLTIGSTLLILTPPKCIKEHLYIIIAVENKSGKALLVNVITHKKGCDKSCILRLGQHSFLNYLSIINYADAQIVEVSVLEYLLKEKLIKSHEPFTPIQLKRIQKCGLNSPAIPGKCRDFLSANI